MQTKPFTRAIALLGLASLSIGLPACSVSSQGLSSRKFREVKLEIHNRFLTWTGSSITYRTQRPLPAYQAIKRTFFKPSLTKEPFLKNGIGRDNNFNMAAPKR